MCKHLVLINQMRFPYYSIPPHLLSTCSSCQTIPPLPQQYMLCIFHIPPLTNSCREVCDSYLQPWPVDHLEFKCLQSQIPTGDLCVGILHAVEPLEPGIVRTESESPSQQVVMESEDRLIDGQPFLLCRAVFSLSFIESLRLIYSREFWYCHPGDYSEEGNHSPGIELQSLR